MSEEHYFKKCTSCKKEIAWKTKYYVCNVTTCTRKRTGLTFCSVSCWDAHVPILRHKESWSEERISPKNLTEFLALEAAEESERERTREREKKMAEAELKRLEEEKIRRANQPKTVIRRSSQ